MAPHLRCGGVQARVHKKNIAIQLLHRWMAAHTVGRVDSGNVIHSDLRWLYHAIVSLRKCNPLAVMVRNWFCQRSDTRGKLAFKGYLQMMVNNVATTNMMGRQEQWMPPTLVNATITCNTIITEREKRTFYVGKSAIKLPCVEIVRRDQRLPPPQDTRRELARRRPS